MDNIYFSKVKAVLAKHIGKVAIVSVLVLVLIGTVISRNVKKPSSPQPQNTPGADVTLATAQLDKKINVTATRVTDKGPVKVDVSIFSKRDS